jgi:hypothetical protein
MSLRLKAPRKQASKGCLDRGFNDNAVGNKRTVGLISSALSDRNSLRAIEREW